MEKYFSIQTVACLTGLHASTIRFYESEGLIKGIHRSKANIRQFTQKDIDWIEFLAKLKEMEMPLAMMKQYAALREKGDETISARMALLRQHKKALRTKIENLHHNMALLENKIQFYQNMKGKDNE